MDYTVILNLILVLTIIIITRISLKINNTNNNLLQQINLFLEQERVGNVFELINEVGFSDIWVEWFLEYVTTLNK